jgi:hypothetical protein
VWAPRSTVVDATSPSYGADPYGVNDSTAAIQAALNTGKDVHLPAGTYKVTSTLFLDANGGRITGDGPYLTVIAPSFASADNVIEVGNAGAATRFHNRLTGFSITGTATTDYAIWILGNCSRWTLTDLRVTGCTATNGYAVGMSSSGTSDDTGYSHFSGAVNRCEFSANNGGALVRGRHQHLTFHECLIYNNNNFGINAESPEDSPGGRLNIVGCQVEKNGTVADSTGSIRCAGIDVVNIQGLYNEQDGTYPGYSILLDQDTGGRSCRQVTIRNASGVGNNAATKSIILKYVDDLLIEYCRILTFTNTPVSYEAGAINRVRERGNSWNQAAQQLLLGGVDPRQAAANAVITATDVYLSSFTVDQATFVTKAYFSVATAAGNVDLGIYDSTGARIASTGSTACPAAGARSINYTAGAWLRPGVKYWNAIVGDSASAAFHYAAVTATGLVGTLGLSTTVAGGGLPLPLSLTIGTTAISRAYFVAASA